MRKSFAFFNGCPRWLLAAVLLFGPGLSHSPALLDGDGNGRSDIYEELYQIPPLADGASDWDGDGFTLNQESLMGTDPRDYASKLAMALLGDPEYEALGELPILIASITGKRYQVETSTDRSIWLPLGGVLLGTGSLLQVTTTLPDDGVPLFFRYTCLGDTDTDGDGLTAWEERQLGTSDLNSDSDGDGLGDYWEMFHGFDPSLPDADGDEILDADEDPDGDHLTNYWEQFLNRDPNNPDTDGDALDDSHEDTDGDGMTDGEEISLGFDLFQPGNAFEDADGDGYPNVFEVRRGSLVYDPTSFPAPDVVVGQGESSEETSIQAAIDSLDFDYGVVSVEPGVYLENVTISAHPTMIVGQGGYPGVRIDGQGLDRVLTLHHDAALLGLQVIHGNAVAGGGFYAYQSRVRFTNCILLDSESDHGAGGVVDQSQVWLQNCTIFHNHGYETTSGIEAYGEGASLGLDHCIVWNPTAENTAQLAGYDVPVTVTHSDVLGGYAGEGNMESDPLLNGGAHLTISSPCVNAGSDWPGPVRGDIDGESRSDAYCDLGADEYWDQDGDGLPDGFEIMAAQKAALQGVTGKFDPTQRDTDGDGIADGEEDFDGDGLGNLYEYANGYDPTLIDSDNNGTDDGQEDKDQNGIANADDAAPKRYIVIPIAPSGNVPHRITNSGYVLMAGTGGPSRWYGGVMTPLSTTFTGPNWEVGCSDINEAGTVVGNVHSTLEENFDTYHALWQAGTSVAFPGSYSSELERRSYYTTINGYNQIGGGALDFISESFANRQIISGYLDDLRLDTPTMPIGYYVGEWDGRITQTIDRLNNHGQWIGHAQAWAFEDLTMKSRPYDVFSRNVFGLFTPGIELGFRPTDLNDDGLVVGYDVFGDGCYYDGTISGDSTSHTLFYSAAYYGYRLQAVNNRYAAASGTAPAKSDYQLLANKGTDSILWEKPRNYDGPAANVPYRAIHISSLLHNGDAWSQISGQDINDNGIICAIAVNNADQATYPVLLVPVEIEYHTQKMQADEWNTYSPLIPAIPRRIGTVSDSIDSLVSLRFKDENNILQNADVEWRGAEFPTTLVGKSTAFTTQLGNMKVELWINGQYMSDVELQTVSVGSLTEVEAAILWLAAINAVSPYTLRDMANMWAYENRVALGGGFHNGGADAGKHSYFNALAAKYWGIYAAADLATAHEFDNFISGGGLANESCMDITNNEIGRSIPGGQVGYYDEDMALEVLKRVREGKMTIKDGKFDPIMVAGETFPDGTEPVGTILNPGGSGLLVKSNNVPRP